MSENPTNPWLILQNVPNRIDGPLNPERAQTTLAMHLNKLRELKRHTKADPKEAKPR
jgi:hypothetical protein